MNTVQNLVQKLQSQDGGLETKLTRKITDVIFPLFSYFLMNIEPEYSGKRSQSRGHMFLERDFNTSIVQKAREGTISELIANM